MENKIRLTPAQVALVQRLVGAREQLQAQLQAETTELLRLLAFQAGLDAGGHYEVRAHPDGVYLVQAESTARDLVE